MEILLVRHSISEANNRENVGYMAFAAKDAPLMPQGEVMAHTLGKTFRDVYNVVPEITEVATSELLRAKQTAQFAGFTSLHAYAHLDEVVHGIPLKDLKEMLKNGELPDIALEEAQKTLDNPPKEGVWVTHGLRIAGICSLLNVHQDKRLIPQFCEIRPIQL